MPVVGYILTALVAYLLGSLPTGFIVARARGVDIRTVGSGNIGATNVFRHLGLPAGVFVLLVDALKGWVAVELAADFLAAQFYPAAGGQTREWFRIVAAVAAVLGHNYTCWLHFKGGKGIATSAGVLLALVPWALAIILGVFIVVALLTRYASLASICAAAVLPIASFVTGCSGLMVGITSGLAVLAIYKHRSNIRRLLAGTESKLGQKPAPKS